MTENTKREALRIALAEISSELIDAVLDGIGAAGANPEWDSETIEIVMRPIEAVLQKAGALPAGSQGPEDEYVKFWCEVIGQDYEGDFEEEEEEPTTYTIKARYVNMIDATVSRGQYHGGGLALIAEGEDDEGFPDRETLSVNLVSYDMDPGEGHVFVRDVDEHEGLPDSLVTAGIAVYAGTSEDDARVTYGPFNSVAYRMLVSEDIL